MSTISYYQGDHLHMVHVALSKVDKVVDLLESIGYTVIHVKGV